MSEKRMGRVEEELKRVISNILQNDLKNPNIKGIISVTAVNVSNDLKYAYVYLSIFDKKGDTGNMQNDVLAEINKSKGYIRKELASKISLRYTPELIFKIDNAISYGAHIDEILNNIIPKE